jgi:hypothetical protein
MSRKIYPSHTEIFGIQPFPPSVTPEDFLTEYSRELTRVNLLFGFKEKTDPKTSKPVDVATPLNVLMTFLEQISRKDYLTITPFWMNMTMNQLEGKVWLGPFHHYECLDPMTDWCVGWIPETDADKAKLALVQADRDRLERIKVRLNSMITK